MSQTAAISTITAPDEVVANATTLDLLRSAREKIADADPDTLMELKIWAEAVRASAAAKKAADIALQASETKFRAELRLGELLSRDDGLCRRLDIAPAHASVLVDLAAIPARLREETVRDMLARGKSCAIQWVIHNARRSSLKKVEAGIWIAWDGQYFTHDPDTKRPTRIYASDLDGAREALRKSWGLKKDFRSASAMSRIDEAHARSRRLAQSLSLLGQHVTGETLARIQRAELLQGEVANLLYGAWTEASRAGLSVHVREEAS